MTAAFQGNAFQPNAFQMGSDGAPAPADQNSLISDGNDTVMILHEQDQHTDHLGTISVGQNVGCEAPEIVGQAATEILVAATTHLINLPSGIQSGDRLIVSARSGGEWQSQPPAGWHILSWSASTSPLINVITLWKDADGTEGSTLSLDVLSSSTAFAFSYRIQKGSFDPYVAPAISESNSATSASPDPASFTAPWSGETLFIARTHQVTVSVGLTYTGYPANMPDWRDVTTNGTPADNGATASAQSTTSTFDADSFTLSAAGTTWTARTIAVKGDCNSEAPLQSHICLDDQDFTDTSEYGWVARQLDDADEECLFPVVTSVTAGSDLTTGTAHVVSFTGSVGDGILVVLATNGNTHTATAGWTEVVDNESVVSYWRVLDGTEGGTMTITSSASSESVWYVYRIQGGTFDPSTAPAAAATLNSATQDPPNLSWGWDDKTLVLAAIAGDTATSPITFTSGPVELTSGFNGQETGGIALPDCYLAVAYGNIDGSSLNPSAFVITAQSSNYDLATIAIRGNCRVQQAIINLDDQDWTDDTDYGSVTPPVPEDGVAPGEDFLLGTGAGLDTQDFTDEADYGDFVAPLSDDNNPDVAPSSLDDQDFTDTEDYGSVTPQAVPDNNPEVAPSSLDDQDFTDTADYGDFVEPLSDDNNPEVAPSSLDDQDFTDFTDYSDYVLQLSDDFVLREDFILGDGQGLDTQDFTDLEDYGSVTAPLSDDSVDFLLGTGDGLDFQDFTDTEDYSYTLAPLSDDNNPEVAPSSLDDQDFTDLEDYGSVTPQAVPDNNPVIAPSDLDTQDFTDTEDYGLVVPQAIPDNNPEIAPSSLDDQDFTDEADYGDVVQQAIEDNNPEIAPSSLDDQDFTDLEDYGSFTAPLSDDTIAPEDFILGDGQGLDTQDFTDYTDYGYAAWLTPGDVTEVYVTGGLITVSIGCFHIDAWQLIADPATSWSNISDPSTLWNGIPDVSTVWSTPSDGSTDWTEIPNPSTPWTEEC